MNGVRATRTAARAALLLVFAALATHTPAWGREGGSALPASVATRLARAGLREGGYSIAVARRAPERGLIRSAGADDPLVPASIAKVFTAAAALDRLGPGFSFRTRLALRGELLDGVWQGDVLVHGDGDPALGDENFGDVPDVAERFAAALAAQGVRRVAGSLVADDLLFDRQAVHDTWTEADRRAAYGAGVAALTLDRGCLRLVVTNDGARTTVAWPHGASPWPIENKLAIAGKQPAIGTRWEADGARLVLTGTVPADRRAEVLVPAPSPPLLFLGALRARLAARGIAVDGARLARDAADARSAKTLAEHATPLVGVVAYFLQRSDNVYASSVFKRVGAAAYGVGTWATGERAVDDMLRARGIDPGRIERDGRFEARTRIVDGSGLSPASRTTARTSVEMLSSFDRDLVRGPLLATSLATSGMTGTLRKRLKDGALIGRVRAKTGTLDDVRVRTLIGYVDGKGTEPGLVFAILLQGGTISHVVVDDVLRELVAQP